MNQEINRKLKNLENCMKFNVWGKKFNLKNYLLIIFIAIVVILCDQITKILVLQFFGYESDSVYHITPFFNLILVHNYGVSFGFLNIYQLSPYYFVIISIIITGIICFWYFSQKQMHKKFSFISVALIIGGAFSNVIDRFTFSAVIDFLDFHLYEYHYPAFNIADAAIVIGAILILLNDFLFNKKQ